jgi:hypothetical protein
VTVEYVVIDMLPLMTARGHAIELQEKLNYYARMGFKMHSHEGATIILEKDDASPTYAPKRPLHTKETA